MKTNIENQPPFDKGTHDLVIEIVAENMPKVARKTLGALRSTSRFFSNHHLLKERFDSQPWCELALGTTHTVLLTHDKRLYVCGSNDFSQLGKLERPLSGFTPCIIGLLEKDEYITQIAAGPHRTLLLSNKERLIVSGLNVFGGLGCESKHQIETNFIHITIKALEQDERIVCMQAGDLHTLLLTNKGRLLGSGENECGQLGLPENHSYFGFEVCKVDTLKHNECVIKVIAGMYQTLLLTSQNRVLVAGLNEDMMLGVSNEDRPLFLDMINRPFIQGFVEANITDLEAEDPIIDMAISLKEVFLLTHKGQLFSCTKKDTFNRLTVAALQTGEMINQVVAAIKDDNAFILTNQGRLLAKGSNNCIEENTLAFEACDLGFLATDETIIHIVAADDHILLLTSKARVFGCGSNVHGQLGFPKNKPIFGFQECDLGVIKNNVLAEKEEVMQSPCFS